MTTYTIRHGHGTAEYCDSLDIEGVLARLRGVYGPDIVTAGDPDDDVMLVWRDEDARELDGCLHGTTNYEACASVRAFRAI